MFFLTNIELLLYLVQKKPPKNKTNKQTKYSQMKQVHWKPVLIYLVNAPILKAS